MKELIAVSIIVFWLAFPFGLIMMDSDNFKTLDTTKYKQIKEPTAFDFFGGLWDFISIYFKAMYMIVPNSPAWLTLIIIILQVISALIVYLLLRGN